MADIKQYSVEDLKKEIADKREALRAFRFGGAGSRTRNVREGRNLRKEIAWMLTELRARELASKKKTT
ncbi:50S ribosomal protein L29 [Candidatus Kaiserbacteria bacterium]|nr:50S ribosomal protein L29 [Candidatus Kaiserbacteria bacterium]